MPEETHDKILSFLRILRESHPEQFKIFTEGSCYQLCVLLAHVVEGCTPLYTDQDGHWITRIDARFYDVGGRIAPDYGKERCDAEATHVENTSADVLKAGRTGSYEKYTAI